MGFPAPTELILILVIVILVFGTKRIPEIMGSVAQGIKVFKKSMESDEAHSPNPPAPEPPPAQLTSDAKDPQPGEQETRGK